MKKIILIVLALSLFFSGVIRADLSIDLRLSTSMRGGTGTPPAGTHFLEIDGATNVLWIDGDSNQLRIDGAV